ncbi:DUF86 domain-containing protein [Anaerobacillus alkaliphilus]|uniref:DUF86 domain-containing protein n=1 Tax=Anaerobacillus alkaliphilus TaxID=1548597 RepID=A0A4Q0VN57_9BACI|nr:DUF86 domain-containing protein [Anaerobacillus alkaliphilus]RXI96573.1 DUF86 domain-containing protein [Anaerobacillus alkaliphilus]
MKTDRIYITHILECIDNINSYVQEEKDFLSSRLIQDAVIRNLEVIGEAINKGSKDLREREKLVPWSEMAGLRDVLIHNYFGVDLSIVWKVVENELPKIKPELQKIKANL